MEGLVAMALSVVQQQTAREKVQSILRQARENVQSILRQAGEKVQSILRQVGEKVQSILRQAREKVQSRLERRTEANRERWRNQTALDLSYSTNIHSLITAPLGCVCTYMVNSVTFMNIVRSGVTLEEYFHISQIHYM